MLAPPEKEPEKTCHTVKLKAEGTLGKTHLLELIAAAACFSGYQVEADFDADELLLTWHE